MKDFIYLWENINSTNDTLVCYFGLSKQLGSKLLTRKSIIMLYNTLIFPVLLYRADCWAISKIADQNLGSFERRILRRIFGPVCEEGEWRRSYNREFYELYKDVDVVRRAKIRRLHWLGYIEGMGENAKVKRIFQSETEPPV